jgi:hypothetical protein
MQTKGDALITVERRPLIPNKPIQEIHTAKAVGNISFMWICHTNFLLGIVNS